MKPDPVIVLFDGECNLCNGFVQFLIRQDKTGRRFRFAAQQSEIGQSMVAGEGLVADGKSAETILVFANGRLLTHSDAALEIVRNLPFPFFLIYVGKVLPKPLRNALYNFVAKNRYKWFGKRDECMMPTSELRARFL
jgi:predicted DCC family thiol-disulfide oxidoreductase YuxK